MPSLRLYNFISAVEHPTSRLLSSSAAAAPVASDLRHSRESRLTACFISPLSICDRIFSHFRFPGLRRYTVVRAFRAPLPGISPLEPPSHQQICLTISRYLILFLNGAAGQNGWHSTAKQPPSKPPTDGRPSAALEPHPDRPGAETAASQ